MKKSLVMLLVASLLLAGCTELLDSGDGETLKIEVDEEIAIEKLNGVPRIEVLLSDVEFGWEMWGERCRGRDNRNFQCSGSMDQLFGCHRLGRFA